MSQGTQSAYIRTWEEGPDVVAAALSGYDASSEGNADTLSSSERPTYVETGVGQRRRLTRPNSPLGLHPTGNGLPEDPVRADH